MFRLPLTRIPEVSGNKTPPRPSTDAVKLRGEIIFIPTNDTYTEGDPHLLEPILRTISINIYLWDERLVISGRQLLQWRCSHDFKVVIKRDGDAEPLFESSIEFDPTPDTSRRALRAEIDVQIPIHWTDKVCVEVSSDGEMPLHDVRGVIMSHREMNLRFMALGNAKDNSPRLVHLYRDEDWDREREVLVGLGLDQSLMAGLEDL